ncbi:hypothetical protein M404DRAFT_1009309, partial [Pisolithus tinctorius Marx 270]
IPSMFAHLRQRTIADKITAFYGVPFIFAFSRVSNASDRDGRERADIEPERNFG